MSDQSTMLAAAIPREHSRLIRLCTHLTGDATVAEDLVQETLVEAWRNVHKLYDPKGCGAWLAAIARNVCRRWGHQQGRLSLQPFAQMEVAEDPSGSFDLEVELERRELVDLLDRALALLSPQARQVLIERYVHDLPHAEIAARLGISEGTVRVQVHRGAVRLRRVLTTQLRDEAAAYGLIDTPLDAWQETRVWCAACGQRRLQGHLDASADTLILRCPLCCTDPRDLMTRSLGPAGMFNGIKGYRAALSRFMAWSDTYCRNALAVGSAPCLSCGRESAIHMSMGPDDPPVLRQQRGFHIACPHCPPWSSSTLRSLTLSLPAAQRFWRRHPRLHVLPERLITAAGLPAFLIRLQSMNDAASLDVIVERTTYAVISMHGDGNG